MGLLRWLLLGNMDTSKEEKHSQKKQKSQSEKMKEKDRKEYEMWVMAEEYEDED